MLILANHVGLTAASPPTQESTAPSPSTGSRNAYTSGFVTPPPQKIYLGSAGKEGGAPARPRKRPTERGDESATNLTKRARLLFAQAAKKTTEGNLLSKLATEKGASSPLAMLVQ